jgi:hypothetical protein
MAAVAAAIALAHFRGSRPHEPAFPSEITCTQGATTCTPGRSAAGHAFRLLKVAQSSRNMQIVGAGADAGNGRQLALLICTRPGNGIRCGFQPAGGEKRLGLYLPA